MRRRSSGGIGGLRLAASCERRALEPRQLELGLVGLAERHDARQELRPAAAALGQQRDQRAGGAAVRHIDGDVGKRRRDRRQRPDEAAVEQRIHQGRQEGATRRDGKDVRVATAMHSSTTSSLAGGEALFRLGDGLGLSHMQPLPVQHKP